MVCLLYEWIMVVYGYNLFSLNDGWSKFATVLVYSVRPIYLIHLNTSMITFYRVGFANRITHDHLVIPYLMNPATPWKFGSFDRQKSLIESRINIHKSFYIKYL